MTLCYFPRCQSRVHELSQAQVSFLCGFPHHDLNPFAHIIPPLLLLDFKSVLQCLAMDLCIRFHQLLDEGSVMTIRMVTNLITAEGQFRYPLHCRLES